MKYLLMARPSFGETSRPSKFAMHAAEELTSLGHEVNIFTFVEFYLNCSYIERKLYKLGIKGLEDKYDQNLLNKLQKVCETFKPDVIIILTALGMSQNMIKYLSKYKIILRLWDSVQRFPDLEEFMPYVQEIFCFEHDDVEYLSKKYNIPARHVPLGADEKVYYPLDRERDIDISFVGAPYKNRINLLEKICKQAYKNNWTVKIGGPWYDSNHFWKKYQFCHRYPYLSKYVENRYFDVDEVSELYCRSKICLNINETKHHSLSPRTFEICATNSFQIMNTGQQSHGYLDLQKSLVLYEDENDLLTKIEYYLNNEEERAAIAKYGYESTIKKCTLQKIIRSIFDENSSE